MRGGLEGGQQLWQLRAMSWLPEEEDRERLRGGGFGVLRARDRFEFDISGVCRAQYLSLSNDDMRAAGQLMESWGYDDRRPMNTLEAEGSELGATLTELWEEALLEPSEIGVAQLIQQGGRVASGACWSNGGHSMRIFWQQLYGGQLPFSGPIQTVLFNDVAGLLARKQPTEEKAAWWLSQGVPGVVIRFLQDGAAFWREVAGVTDPQLQREEGLSEKLAREMLYDRGNLGRILRDLIEQDLVVGVLERGLENLCSRKAPVLGKWVSSGICSRMGDWLLAGWWAWAERARGTVWDSHLACARYRRQRWPEGAHPLLSFELTEDDRELIRQWVLQHRARLATGRWEYSPGWAFYPVPIQIFWLHGLETGEGSWFGDEHNDSAMVAAFELITEHVPDVPSRWVPNDSDPPRINDLDWRIREVIVPEVEAMARDFCESVGVPCSLEADPRWIKTFRSWESTRQEAGEGIGQELDHLAGQLKKAEVVEVALELIEEYGWQEGEGDAEKANQLISDLCEVFESEGVARWMAGQGFVELVNLNELISFSKSSR